jgi:hypothetical protein
MFDVPGARLLFVLLTFVHTRLTCTYTSLNSLMSAAIQFPRLATSNRRRSMRQKIRAPVYASFGGGCSKEITDLCRGVDISENGIAMERSGVFLQFTN